MRECRARGAFRRYADAASLCAALGVDAEAFAEHPRRTSSAVDERHRRGRRALGCPLYAAPLTSGILATQGGLDVDTTGRVLRGDGSAIPGLYAGGGTAVGISGPTSRGYSSGNGLLTASASAGSSATTSPTPDDSRGCATPLPRRARARHPPGRANRRTVPDDLRAARST